MHLFPILIQDSRILQQQSPKDKPHINFAQHFVGPVSALISDLLPQC